MRALWTALLLGLIGYLALDLRRAGEAGHLLEEPLPDGTVFLVDDPDAAYQLRRVQLALANGHVPLVDRFLNHPEGSAIPWPSAFAGALALIAQVSLERSEAAEVAATGGYAEGELEALLARVPPWLGALSALAVAAAAAAFLRERGPGRSLAAVVSAAVFAATPVAVWYGSSGRIDHHVAVQLLLAVELALVGLALRAKEPLDAITFGLLGGLVGGALLLLWLASAPVVGLCAAALWAAAFWARGKQAVALRRAGALYLAAAAVVVLVPAEASPWNEVQPGSLVNLSLGVPRALLGAAVPFAALEVASRLAWSRGLAFLASVLATAAVVWLLPGFTAGVREGIDWASRENLFMDVVAESRPLLGRGEKNLGLLLSDLGLQGLLLPLAWLALAAREVLCRRFFPERWLLLATAALWAAQTLGQRRFGDGLAVPMAMLLALGCADLVNAQRPFVRRTGWAAALLLVLGLVPSVAAVHGVPKEEHKALLAWRREIVEGLRWMRANTPSPGPWNAPLAHQDYGVLAPWGLGHGIEYHGRRPTLATNFGSFVGERNFRGAAEAWMSTEPGELAAKMQRAGARYAVVRARDASDLLSTARIAGWDEGRRSELFSRSERGKGYSERARATALFRLALHQRAPLELAPGEPLLQLVYASAEFEALSGGPARPGEASGPRLSIWRLLEAGASLPQLSPGPDQR